MNAIADLRAEHEARTARQRACARAHGVRADDAAALLTGFFADRR